MIPVVESGHRRGIGPGYRRARPPPPESYVCAVSAGVADGPNGGSREAIFRSRAQGAVGISRSRLFCPRPASQVTPGPAWVGEMESKPRFPCAVWTPFPMGLAASFQHHANEVPPPCLFRPAGPFAEIAASLFSDRPRRGLSSNIPPHTGKQRPAVAPRSGYNGKAR